MSEFEKFLKITKILLSDKGCAWDRKQTFESLKTTIIEEAYELLDAVDEKDNRHILEELGDIFFLTIFYANIAQKNNLFSLDDVIKNISSKLVRRHPHVFGDEKIERCFDA